MACGGERQHLHVTSLSVGSAEFSPQVFSDRVLAGCAHQLLQHKLNPVLLQISQL